MEVELKSIAEAAAAGIDGDMHQALYASDLPPGRPVEDPRYRELVDWLGLVQELSGRIRLPDDQEPYRIYPYTYVAAAEPDVMEFVASAGARLPEPEGAEFRELDTIRTQVMRDGFSHTSAHVGAFIVDRWGTWVTATSPIYDSQGKIVGAVGIDMQDVSVAALQDRIRDSMILAFIAAYALSLIATILIPNRLARSILVLTQSAEQIAQGDDSLELVSETNRFLRSEITTLTQVFAHMARNVFDRTKELTYSQARDRALINSLPGPAFLADNTGRMLFVSPQIESLLGYTVEEWLGGDGRLWVKIIHPDQADMINSYLADLDTLPGMGQIETRMRHKDGSYRWIEGRYTLFSSQDRLATAGIILDIEARQRAQAQLQSNTEKLQAAYQELQETHEQLVRAAKLATVGALATGMAPERTNPLAAIRGLAQILLARAPEEGELRKPLDQIVLNTDRMNRTVGYLQDFARQTSTEQSAIKLNLVLDSALTLLHTQLIKHNIELVKEYDPDLPLIRGVWHRLEQVVINLLTNACDAIQEKGGPGRITLRTWYEPADNQINFSVTDTGAGIHPEHHAHIIDPFFTTKSSGNGTGLGLTISHRIIQEHQGQILFESQLGKGTTFTVALPARSDLE